MQIALVLYDGPVAIQIHNLYISSEHKYEFCKLRRYLTIERWQCELYDNAKWNLTSKINLPYSHLSSIRQGHLSW